ncbi:MAG: biotin/lipoyl-binding protein [Bacilli bacterium]
MKQSKSILTKINIAAFAALALVLAAGCDKKNGQGDQKETQAPVVKVMNPIKKNVDMWDEYTARIDALAYVELRARVSGYLEKVFFVEGQDVKEGDMLFRIDPRPYQAALIHARLA